MTNRIFISYRRDGGDIAAKLICEALKNKGYTVFYDYDSLKGGVFDSKILDAIDQCTDVILVLPKNALARCKHENDWVRQEIRRALEKEKNIIPVMMDKFEFPKRLPPDICAVSRYNGVRFQMDFFDSVIDKIIENLSSNRLGYHFTGADGGSAAEPENPRDRLTDNVKFVIYLHAVQGFGSDIILYSPESSDGKISKYDFTEEKWEQFAELIKKTVSCLFRTDEEMVSVALKSPLGLKDCAPCDGSYFDEQYRIRFDVNYISDCPPEHFESLHLEISNGSVRLTLFDKGDYVFHSVSDQTPISYFGIDEAALIDAIKPLVSFAEHTPKVIVSKRFENRVYSDKSGGYYLKYLT